MWPEQHRHQDCRTSTAALPTTWCFEVVHVASTNTTEGQALWPPGGTEENSREDDRHLRLAYDDEDEEQMIVFWCKGLRGLYCTP